MEVEEPLTNGVNGSHNGHTDNSHSKHRSKETEEERRIRKEKERKARENETEEERRIRKEKERKERDGKKSETEEERRARKERERKERDGKEKRKETEEERALRKERERKEREERYKNETEEERLARKEREKREGKRHETEEERAARKERERKEGKDRKHETEEERAARKEKERKERDERRKNETEEERAARKERERRERDERYKNETEEERRMRKERERKEKKSETEEERAARKERERQERKEKERREQTVKKEVKDEPMELGDDYFAAEEARLSKRDKDQVKNEIKEEEEEEGQENGHANEEEGEGDEEGMEEDDEDEFKPEVKEEESEDEDVPLAQRKTAKNNKRKMESEGDSEDESLSKRKAKNKKQKKKVVEEEEEDFKPVKKKPKVEKKTEAKSPTKKMTKKEKELEAEKKVWKWWEEEEQLPEGVKWRFLEHKGPLFAPDYERLPEYVKFYYDGKSMKLSRDTEEVATFYGKMIEHDYTTKEVFNKNFFKDWRKIMNDKEKEIIRDLQKCDFTAINEHFKKLSEERKNRSKEEKKAEKERNEAIVEEYGFCIIDGHREKIGNFRTEPPSLFRGRGEHPKQGMVKRRIIPEDVIINCSKDSNVPEPPEGHKWKKVQHDNTVTWLASWTENIQGQIKYIMLNPSSKLKGEKDWQKYEKARNLKTKIDKIRDDYMQDLKSKEMRVRQRAVALYFIDKLALRAGNEKDEDQADTVGCCSLRFEHIELHDEMDGKEYVVEFDFLGKDSIRYQNAVSVEKRVYKNLKLFMENKKAGDDLFDRLNTSILNQYLNSLMDGLTAKVFRTYNASFTLQQQLDELTNEDDPIQAKLLSYNRANRAVAVLCNHQRAVPKTHEKSMENLNGKIEAKQEAIQEAQKQLKAAKKAAKNGGSDKGVVEKKKKALERLLEQLEKLEIQKTDKDENKTIALGTSKLNYLDPRISVAWCKKHDVPIEKVYNKTQREKFRWAIDMAEADYVF